MNQKTANIQKEYPEETEESEGEEAEAVWIVAYWSEEDPADCCYRRDYGY